MTAVLDADVGAEGLSALPEFRTGDPIVGSTLALRKNPLTALIEPYRRFGRIFRMRLLGRSVVVIAGLDANEFAWRDAEQWSWSRSGAVFREQFGPNYLTQLEGPAHRDKRKRLAPAFRPRTLERLAPAMADVWFAGVSDSADRTVDLRELCQRLVVQTAGRALLCVDLPAGADSDIARLEHDLLAGAALGRLRRLWFSRPSYRARKRDLTAFLTRVVRERRRDWSGDDMVSEILRGLPHGALIPSVDELVNDVILLLQAGSESTANQILWTLLLLRSRPEWLAELREELEAWSPEAMVSRSPEAMVSRSPEAMVSRSPEAMAFPKLRATVLESERLRPAIPFAVRVAARDLAFSSRRIPAGANVLHAATITHFLDEIYDDPMSFRPERFLGADGTFGGGANGCPTRAHGTFGGGAHSCLGQPLARLQVPLGVAVIAKHAHLTMRTPVSLRSRLDGVVTPVERELLALVTLRAG